ncbi:hypothetical protein W97_03481 [Neofusicoccum parvum]|uniref:Uncharacterized protein n=1 Tax=Neofusicoccum parvum TaxID=310453 RepID=A0ACB5SI84_9PEZI|nr:hypothetical protein W97_03481 [Neofusicoccum parvum]
MPIFSQSKAPGFNDIRHPSAWNYMDKAHYSPNEAFPDPAFDEKARTLFWRGASSEGYAIEGQSGWNGMARQRMVYLLTNSTSPQPLLLPDDDAAASPRFRTALVDASTLRDSISTDVRFTHFTRCHAPECGAQEALFGVGARADFQAHWGHRYLLDADGAGFSGRFVPFLLSRSLPFKMALFREWWDSRLTPWLHFVPLDLRGHGVWATLAYFAGFEGVVAGRRVGWAPRDAEARGIAEEGAEWARKVLRKEDMEIYMFRLLLEWGRLTDDKRLEIGFSV